MSMERVEMPDKIGPQRETAFAILDRKASEFEKAARAYRLLANIAKDMQGKDEEDLYCLLERLQVWHDGRAR